MDGSGCHVWALDPESGEMLGGGDIEAETRQVLQNLDAVLQRAGASRADVAEMVDDERAPSCASTLERPGDAEPGSFRTLDVDPKDLP